MTGYPNYNFEAFNSAEKYLRSLGYEDIENPARKGVIDGWTWSDYLKYDIILVCNADLVVTLTNWQESKGAVLEVYVAQALGIPVIPLMAVRPKG